VEKEKKRGCSGDKEVAPLMLLCRLRNCDAYVAKDDVMKEGERFCVWI